MKKERVKKSLNVAQRVEILLREGVSNDEWRADVSSDAFLLEVISEMREQILALEIQLDAQYENDRGVDG